MTARSEMTARKKTTSRAIGLTRVAIVAVAAAVTVGYYLLPAGGRLSPASWVAVFIAWLVVLGTRSAR